MFSLAEKRHKRISLVVAAFILAFSLMSLRVLADDSTSTDDGGDEVETCLSPGAQT